MHNKTTITIADGDGIGPAIMESTIKILEASNAELEFQSIELGKKVFDKTGSTGISAKNIDLIKKNKILLKAPTTTPQGKGFRSINVELRKILSLYANVRPAKSYHPIIPTIHKNMDVVVIRENEEDLYAGIEYRQTNNLREAIKIASQSGCERIIRFAFNYALQNDRKKICCFSKDNILKFSEGILHSTFDKIATEYGNKFITKHLIVDIGAALLANRPNEFDVVVTSNLFGDIISDITAEISSSVGMCGSANIGDQYAVFEAIHGSAPDIANQNIANPSALINASIMMLKHIGKYYTANLIENALNKTLEDGIHTQDIYNAESSRAKVSTKEFTDAIIERLGSKPNFFKIANNVANLLTKTDKFEWTKCSAKAQKAKKKLVGVDIYFDIKDSIDNLSAQMQKLISDLTELKLDSIYANGLKLWPNLFHSNSLREDIDHICCRFLFYEHTKPIQKRAEYILELLKKIILNKYDYTKLNNLYYFDDRQGFSE